MKGPVSLKAERGTLITAMKELTSAKHRLCDIAEGNSDVAELYRKKFLDIEMELGDICCELGSMVGYTMYSDICEGLEVKP